MACVVMDRSQFALAGIPLEDHDHGYSDVDLHPNKVTLTKGEIIVPVAHLSNLLERNYHIIHENESLRTHLTCLQTQVEQRGAETESWKIKYNQLKLELDRCKQASENKEPKRKRVRRDKTN